MKFNIISWFLYARYISQIKPAKSISLNIEVKFANENMGHFTKIGEWSTPPLHTSPKINNNKKYYN